jgi:hypothetical protein
MKADLTIRDCFIPQNTLQMKSYQGFQGFAWVLRSRFNKNFYMHNAEVNRDSPPWLPQQ